MSQSFFIGCEGSSDLQGVVSVISNTQQVNDGDAQYSPRSSGIYRRQPLSVTCPQTGIAAFFKFAAGRGAPFVNAAGGFFANAAIKCGAARGVVVGAAHAAGVFCDW
jgi:hypothetical protein